MTRKWLPWVPAAAVPAIIAAGVLAGPLPASAGDPLPDKSPEQVLALIAQHRGQALSGILEQSSNLGLPELPAGPGAADTAWLELLTGPHTARVYLDGPDNARIQVMDRLAERNAVRQGNELWFYNSRDNTAAHAQLPAGRTDRHEAGSGLMATPEELAAKLLAKLDDNTDVTATTGGKVAGRAAYELLLSPRSTATLVESVAISVDGQSGVPLGVEVKARGQSDPAFRLAFTTLELQAPDPSTFRFTPPPGATVREIPLPEHEPKHGTVKPPSGADKEGGHRHGVTGTGWESVIGFQVPEDRALPTGSASTAGRLREQGTVPVPGGRLLSTSLVNMLILDDGRVFAGAVPVERLQAAAAAWTAP